MSSQQNVEIIKPATALNFMGIWMKEKPDLMDCYAQSKIELNFINPTNGEEWKLLSSARTSKYAILMLSKHC